MSVERACITPAQYRTAVMFAAGVHRHEIASRLGVGLSTVDQHVRAASKRLGVPVDRRSMALSLQSANVGARWRTNRFGYVPGDRVRVTGGRYAGREGVFVQCANSDQIKVRVGGGVFALRESFVHHEGVLAFALTYLLLTSTKREG